MCPKRAQSSHDQFLSSSFCVFVCAVAVKSTPVGRKESKREETRGMEQTRDVLVGLWSV